MNKEFPTSQDIVDAQTAESVEVNSEKENSVQLESGAVLRNKDLIFRYLGEVDFENEDMGIKKLEIDSNELKQKLATAFAQVLDYDEALKQQCKIIESITAVLGDIDADIGSNRRARSTDVLEINLAKIAVSRATLLLKQIQSVEQFDWFCSEIAREYTIASQNSNSAVRYVSTLTFVNQCSEDLMCEGVETLELVRNASQGIIQQLIDTNQHEISVHTTLGEAEDATELMKSLNRLASVEFSEPNDVDDYQRTKFSQLSEAIVRAIDENTSQYKVYRLAEVFAMYAGNRSILHMSSESLSAICKDFLGDDPDELVRLALASPFRMLSQHGGMSLGDSLIYSYGLHRNPLDMTDLMLAQKESPFSDDHSYQLNRALAISIGHEFGTNAQEIIHEQDPYAFQLVQALIDFYETGNNQPYLSVKTKVVRLKAYNDDLDAKFFLDRSKYEKDVPMRNDKGNKIKVIDALRSLRENMADGNTSIPPKTSVPELDESVETAMSNSFESDGVEIQFKKESVMHLIENFNSFIDTYYEGNKERVNLHIAQFASWLEKKAYSLLQSVTSFEEQQKMYKEKWFADILRFYLSIYSADAYNKESIDVFLDNLQKIPERNYRDAYRAIGQLVIQRVSRLSEECSKRGRVYTDTLWGGGLAYQYLSLIDERESLTEYERKYIDERRQDRRMGITNESLYHPGD